MTQKAEGQTQQISVRQVTDVHANWNEEERGEPGKISIQLILDNGAEEYAIRPNAKATKILLKMLDASETVFFDMENSVLSVSRLTLGSVPLEDVAPEDVVAGDQQI